MSKDPLYYLYHIHDECKFLMTTREGLTKEIFYQNEILKRAVVRSLEIIGEATKKIPADFKYQNNTIQWKHLAGMRDRLIHDYQGVDYSIVWDVIENKIPELIVSIENIMNNR